MLTFHVEHIVARQHAGPTTEDNLALACSRCNAHKGPNLTAIDPQTEATVPIFHPRADDWDNHFRIRGGEIVGLTPVGRASVRLLNMNETHRVALRAEWL